MLYLPLRRDEDFDGLVGGLQLHCLAISACRPKTTGRNLVRELYLLSLRSVLLTRASTMGLSHRASDWMRDHLTVSVSSMSCWAKASRTSKRWERDQDLVPVRRGMTNVCPVVPSSADPRTQTWRRASSSPLLLAPADVQAVQRLAEESPVTASLSSWIACRTCRR